MNSAYASDQIRILPGVSDDSGEEISVFLFLGKIAAAMDYDIRWLYRLHGKALEEVQVLLDSK